jgi:myosin heavy subunit
MDENNRSALEGSEHDSVPEVTHDQPEGAKSNDELRAEAQQRAHDAGQPAPEPEPKTPAVDWEAKYQKSVVDYGKQNKENRVMSQQMQELQTQIQQQQQVIDSLKDPNAALQVLEQHGTDYQALTQAVVGAPEPPTPEQAKIAELEATVTQMNQYIQQVQQKEQEQTQQQQQQSAEATSKQFLEENREQYPFLASHNLTKQFLAEYTREVEALGPNPPTLPDAHQVAATLEQRYRQASAASLANLNATGLLKSQLEALGYVPKKTNGEQSKEQTPDQRADSTVTNPKPAMVQPAAPTLSNTDAAYPDKALRTKSTGSCAIVLSNRLVGTRRIPGDNDAFAAR